jgi:NADPH-dependent curcumin reductase CurA
MAETKHHNRAVTLKSYVGKGNIPNESHIEIVDKGYPDLKDGEVRLQTLYISVDPYFRGKMNSEKSYTSPFTLGESISGSGVGKVIETKNHDYHVGDIITSQKQLAYPFQEFVVFDAEGIKQYKKLDASFPKHLVPATIGWLGMPGLTAYFGILEKAKSSPGQALVVSGAAGAVGSIAGQVGKIAGLKVLGIVGNQEKVDYVKQLGFDHAIIYKGKSRDELSKEIASIFPDGVDVYFDNVGGVVSDAVILNMKEGGRVPICGQISSYNQLGITDQLSDEIAEVVNKKKLERGWFLVFNFKDKFDHAWTELVNWEKEGKIKCRETHYTGIDSFLKAFLGLFSGDNVGKAIVDISPL